MKAASCKHEKFSGSVGVGRLINKVPVEFVVDIIVVCDQCGLPFQFDAQLDVVKGIALSGDRYKLRARVKPGEKAFAASASASAHIKPLDSKYDTQ